MTYTAKVELFFSIDDIEVPYPRDEICDIMQDIPYLIDWNILDETYGGE